MTDISRSPFTLRARDFRLDLGQTTKIMGVLNVTPDSFSRDGLLTGSGNSAQRAVRKARRFICEGADILDIGGESSRPGAKPVSAQEETSRILPVLRRLVRMKKAVPVSVDTYKPLVARQALEEGASLINYIQGARPDKRLLKAVRDHKAAIILMHMKGKPKTMQTRVFYRDLIGEIGCSLRKSIEICLEIGIDSDRIIVDPGIGFGKTFQHNLEILRCLNKFTGLGAPLLIGTSRKSFIGGILNAEAPQRLMGTAATVCVAVMKGAHIVRVHDVGAMRDVVRVTDAIINADRMGG